ncbi:DUF503 domain-containing protein [Paraclostridium bifermentans]|uniref:DUF503 domain-containing protein n=1 Tax=Paraclostridium bifermentans TaxID=1490 RepID=UPI001FF1998B|nr:DUF503 domain-containing protein [Paraclostridium bifermentans]UOW69181.1 DUF503 domain-containing protein [Paraclostridium bifermentans]
MKIYILKVDLRASWVHSLKEKRMVVKSITSKLKNKFNISVAEIENQDVHQLVTLGIIGISLDQSTCYSNKENIINFIESNTDAEIINIDEDVLNI